MAAHFDCIIEKRKKNLGTKNLVLKFCSCFFLSKKWWYPIHTCLYSILTVPRNGQDMKKIAQAWHYIFWKGYTPRILKMEKWKCFIHIQRNKFTKPPFLEAKKISRNFRFPIFFLGSKLAKMKTLLCKWHIAIKTYLINLFDLRIIEKFDFTVKMPWEKEILPSL